MGNNCSDQMCKADSDLHSLGAELAAKGSSTKY